MNKLFNKLSAVALATALVAPGAVGMQMMGKNDSGVKFSTHSGVGLYSHHQISGAFWGGLGLSYWKSSDVSLDKLKNIDNAAKQTGTLKKFSVLPGVSYYIGDGFFASFDLMLGKHTMEITPASHIVKLNGVKHANYFSYGAKAIGVALEGAIVPDAPFTAAGAAEADTGAAKTRLEALTSDSEGAFVYTGYGTVATAISTTTADSIAADPTQDSPLVFEHKFNAVQPVFGIGYTTAMMDNSDEVSFSAKLQLAYTGKGKVEYKSGGYTKATAKDGTEGERGKAISTDLQGKLAKKYSDDFKKNSQKKSYWFGASGFAPALEVSVGFSF